MCALPLDKTVTCLHCSLPCSAEMLLEYDLHCSACNILPLNTQHTDISFFIVGFQSTVLDGSVLPPANIHTVLHSLLQGQGPTQTAPVPFLASKQLACVQRTTNILALYTMLNEFNTACSQILMQSVLSPSTASSGDNSQQHSRQSELARSTIQEGAQKLVLAMVNQVCYVSPFQVRSILT